MPDFLALTSRSSSGHILANTILLNDFGCSLSGMTEAGKPGTRMMRAQGCLVLGAGLAVWGRDRNPSAGASLRIVLRGRESARVEGAMHATPAGTVEASGVPFVAQIFL